MSDTEKEEKTEVAEVENKSEKEPKKEPETSGESVEKEDGAANDGVDYSMIMDTLKALQENQAAMSLQLKAVSDAQSVIVDNGAIVREIPADQIDADSAQSDNDEFVPIEELDLSI